MKNTLQAHTVQYSRVRIQHSVLASANFQFSIFNLLIIILALSSALATHAQSLCFDPASDNRYETFESCTDLAVLDVNNDGHDDVIVSGGSEVSIHLCNGDGTFQPYYTSAPGTNQDIELTDADGDGDLDFYSYYGGNCVLGRNLANGFFEWGGYFGVDIINDNTSEMSVGDVTGDGHPDIVVNDEAADLIQIITCDEDGIPAASFSLNPIDAPSGIKVGNINNDSVMDIVVSSTTSEDVAILLGDGNGTFTTIMHNAGPPAGSFISSIEIANTDGDSDNDILVSGVSMMYVIKNNGNETFTSMPDVFMGSFAYGFDVGDWDNDGDTDVAWANSNTGGTTINLNNGDGTFPSVGNAFFSSNGNSMELAVGDFNEDGNPDLVVANGFVGNFAMIEGHGNGKFGSLALLAGNGATGLCAADFNNDGSVDVLATNHYSPQYLALSLNNGDGSFADTQFLDAPINSEECVAGDFDEDGNADVVVHSNQGFQFMAGNGNGTFDEETTFVSANLGEGGDRTIAAGDFNGDGNLDLAGSRVAGNNVAVVYGNGAGSFSAPDVYTDGMEYTRNIIAAHLNNDTYEDIVITSNPNDEVYVYFGTSLQQLSAPLILSTPGQPEGLAAFDADEDGANDLVVVCPNANTLYVFPGNNDMTFNSPIEIDTPNQSNATRGAHADINNDGHEDFICALYQDDAVAIFFGNGDGTFESAVSYQVDQAPNRVLTADFNNDGAMDFSTLNSGIFNVSVVLNNSAFVTADGDLAFCEGNDVTLTASEGYEYEWNNGETTQSITVNQPGEYFCAITNQAGTCTLITTSVDVEVFQAFTVTLDLDSTTVCVENGSFALSGGWPFGGIYSGPGVAGNIFDPAEAGEGTYTITYSYTDPGECTNGSDSDEITVDICSYVSEYWSQEFSVYPSATHSAFAIEGKRPFTFAVMNACGRLISSGSTAVSKTNVTLDEQSAGLYFVKVSATGIDKIFRIEKLN